MERPARDPAAPFTARVFSVSPAPPARHSRGPRPIHLRICWAAEPSRSPRLEPGSGPAPGWTVAVAGGEAEAEASGSQAGVWAQGRAPWPSTRLGGRRFPRLRVLGGFWDQLLALHTCLGFTRAPGSPSPLPPPAAATRLRSRRRPMDCAANGLFGVRPLANGRMIFFRFGPIKERMVSSVTNGNIFPHTQTEALGGARGLRHRERKLPLGPESERVGSPGPRRLEENRLHCLLLLLPRHFPAGAIMPRELLLSTRF